jgi:hypothetical protein
VAIRVYHNSEPKGSAEKAGDQESKEFDDDDDDDKDNHRNGRIAFVALNNDHCKLCVSNKLCRDE